MSFSMMVHLHGMEPLMASRSRKVDPKAVSQLALADWTSQIDQIHITRHTERSPVMSFSIMVHLHGIDPLMTPWSRNVDPKAVFQQTMHIYFPTQLENSFRIHFSWPWSHHWIHSMQIDDHAGWHHRWPLCVSCYMYLEWTSHNSQL